MSFGKCLPIMAMGSSSVQRWRLGCRMRLLGSVPLPGPGVGPEFPVEPSVCDEWDDLPRALTYKTNQARWTIYLSPTCREITDDVEGDGKVGH